MGTIHYIVSEDNTKAVDINKGSWLVYSKEFSRDQCACHRSHVFRPESEWQLRLMLTAAAAEPDGRILDAEIVQPRLDRLVSLLWDMRAFKFIDEHQAEEEPYCKAVIVGIWYDDKPSDNKVIGRTIENKWGN